MLVERREQEKCLALSAEVKRVGARISFADEAGMRSDQHAGPTSARVACTRTTSTPCQRFGIEIVSAVAADGYFHFKVHEGRCTGQVFVAFLERLLHDADRPVFLIVDGHGIHRVCIVRECLKA